MIGNAPLLRLALEEGDASPREGQRQGLVRARHRGLSRGRGADLLRCPTPVADLGHVFAVLDYVETMRNQFVAEVLFQVRNANFKLDEPALSVRILSDICPPLQPTHQEAVDFE